MANTKFEYLYRDACNYKTFNAAILKGEMSQEDYARIQDCCDTGEYFIPSQVGLDEMRNWPYDPEVDHPWFEILGYGFVYTDAPSGAMTVSELVTAFEQCRGKWDPHDPE